MGYYEKQQNSKEYNIPVNASMEASILLSKSIKDELTKIINGGIWCHIHVDTLVIDVYRNGTPFFHYTRKGISSQIMLGINAKIITEDVVKQYTKYIRKLYFM